MLLETDDDVDALVVEAGWSMSRFMQFLVNRVCVDVASSVGASSSSVVIRGLDNADAGYRGCVIDVPVYGILGWPNVCLCGLKCWC